MLVIVDKPRKIDYYKLIIVIIDDFDFAKVIIDVIVYYHGFLI